MLATTCLSQAVLLLLCTSTLVDIGVVTVFCSKGKTSLKPCSSNYFFNPALEKTFKYPACWPHSVVCWSSPVWLHLFCLNPYGLVWEAEFERWAEHFLGPNSLWMRGDIWMIRSVRILKTRIWTAWLLVLQTRVLEKNVCALVNRFCFSHWLLCSSKTW